jgi:tetratricopeptide (TPR) repeat protein
VVVALAVFGGRVWWQDRQATQSRLLGELVQTYNSPITASLEDLNAARPGVSSFTSTEERDRKVLELADAILKRGGSGAAGAGALVYRGIALANLGKPDEAEAALRQALESQAGGLFGPMARLRLARLHEAQGKAAEALPLFQAIAEDKAGVIPPEEGLLGMARCNEALGKKDEADQIYKRLVSEFPDSEYASEARDRVAKAS